MHMWKMDVCIFRFAVRNLVVRYNRTTCMSCMDRVSCYNRTTCTSCLSEWLGERKSTSRRWKSHRSDETYSSPSYENTHDFGNKLVGIGVEYSLQCLAPLPLETPFFLQI